MVDVVLSDDGSYRARTEVRDVDVAALDVHRSAALPPLEDGLFAVAVGSVTGIYRNVVQTDGPARADGRHDRGGDFPRVTCVTPEYPVNNWSISGLPRKTQSLRPNTPP